MSDEPPRRSLPRPVRILLLVVLAALVLVLLFTTVFPWVERNLSNPTLDAGAPASGRMV